MMLVASTWYTNLAEPVRRVFDQVLEFLPSLIGAAILVFIGWVLGKILRVVARRLTTYGLARLGRTSSFEAGLEERARYRRLPDIVGRIIFWFVMLFFIAAGIEALGLRAVSDLLTGTTTYLPRILAATIIIFSAVLGGDLARRWATRAATRAGVGFAVPLGRAVEIGIMVLAVMIAIDQLGIQSRVLVIALTVALGSTFGAAALAFGIGAGATVSNIMAAHYLRQTYRVGQTVRVMDLEGRIEKIDRTVVIMATAEGRVQVPAKRFAEEVSLLVGGGA